jgi:hypothetical protein
MTSWPTWGTVVGLTGYQKVTGAGDEDKAQAYTHKEAGPPRHPPPAAAAAWLGLPAPFVLSEIMACPKTGGRSCRKKLRP